MPRRPPTRLLPASVALVVAVLAGLPAASSAADLDSWASENLRSPADATQLKSDMTLARLECPPGPTKLAPMSLAAALRHAEARLRRDAGAPALRAFRSSRDYRSVDRLRAAAAAAAMANAPEASLAALLRAHELRPRDPAFLVDTAGLLDGLGMPREGLVLADAARALPAPAPAGAGISMKAIELNARGYALLRLGHYRAARASLDKAVALAPQLSEARTNRSAVDVCRDRTLAVFDRGRFRGDLVKPSYPAIDQPQPIERMLHLSDGRPLTPQYVPAPGSAEEATASAAQLQRDEEQLSNYAFAAQGRADSADARFEKRAGFFARQTYRAIADGLERQDALLYDEKVNSVDMFVAVINGMDKLKPFDCGSYRSYWEGVRVAYVHAVDSDVRWARTLSARFDGWSRAFRSEDARRALVEHLLFKVMNDESALANDLAMAARTVSGATYFDADDRELPCFTGGAQTVGEAQASTLDDAGGCNDRPIKVEVFEVVEFEQQCENTSVELHSLGWIGAFGRGTVDWRTGSLTIVVGPRLSAGVTRFGSVEVKAGFYVTIDRHGNISAAGVVMPGASVDVKIEGKAWGVTSGTTAWSLGGERVALVNSFSGWGL